jgi:hypothetical protein
MVKAENSSYTIYFYFYLPLPVCMRSHVISQPLNLNNNFPFDSYREARFSGRSTRIRGSVMFQMRIVGGPDWKDQLPVNYLTGATKFEMTKRKK